MKKIENKTHIEGYLYDYKLSVKTAGENSKNPGTQFITGTVSIETEPGNVDVVTFRYVGDNNKTDNFKVLKSIAEGKNKTVVNSSLDEAALIKIDSTIGVGDFYDIKNEQIVSPQRNEGGFIHLVNSISESKEDRSSFSADTVITAVKEIEADEEKEIEHHLELRCGTFNYRKDLIPFILTVFNKEAINYFLNLNLETPIFTKVWGVQKSQTYKKTKVEKSAFGDDKVIESEYNRKYWVVTGAKEEPYPWDDEDFLTAKEFKETISNREITLAEVKQNRIDYENSKGNTSKSTPTSSTNKIATDSYKF